MDDNTGTARTITNDVFSLQLGTPRGVADITGLDKSAHERLLLLADATCTLAMGFNDAVNMSFAVFKTVPLSTAVARTVTLVHSGQTLPNEMIFSDFAVNRGADGNITTSAPGALSDGTVPTWA